jgi:hypothetical protein
MSTKTDLGIARALYKVGAAGRGNAGPRIAIRSLYCSRVSRSRHTTRSPEATWFLSPAQAVRPRRELHVVAAAFYSNLRPLRGYRLKFRPLSASRADIAIFNDKFWRKANRILLEFSGSTREQQLRRVLRLLGWFVVVDALITMFGMTTAMLLLSLAADAAVGLVIVQGIIEIRAPLLVDENGCC